VNNLSLELKEVYTLEAGETAEISKFLHNFLAIHLLRYDICDLIRMTKNISIAPKFSDVTQVALVSVAMPFFTPLRRDRFTYRV